MFSGYSPRMVETVRDAKRRERFGDLVWEIQRGSRARRAYVRALERLINTHAPQVLDRLAEELAAETDYDPDFLVHSEAALAELIARPEPLAQDAVPMSGGRSTEATPDSEVPNP